MVTFHLMVSVQTQTVTPTDRSAIVFSAKGMPKHKKQEKL